MLGNRYIPRIPHPKEAAFLANCDRFEEVLYGGAAGGGKSDALLCAALQYAEVPGYSALLLRKTFADLSKPGALMDRAREWLAPVRGAYWREQTKTWTFAGGGKLSFGYMEHEKDKFQYQGSEYQFVGFDELVQFSESQYLYMFSRLRKTTDIPVPLRIRAASNPGGEGHAWVRDRFIPDEYMEMDEEERFNRLWSKPINDGSSATEGMCYFLPARLEDNPSINLDEYEANLNKLDPVTRAQLRKGDWKDFSGGRFSREWVRYWRPHGENFQLLGGDGQTVLKLVSWNACQIFHMVDPAGTSKEVAEAKKGRHSWTVISTWALTKDFDLILLDVWRQRVEIPDIVPAIKSQMDKARDRYRGCGGHWVGIENTGIGLAVYQEAVRQGLSVKPIEPAGKGKLERASEAIVRMEGGQIYFPWAAAVVGASTWLRDWEDEIFIWTGDEKEVADQIDTFAHAAKYAGTEAAKRRSGSVPYVVGKR